MSGRVNRREVSPDHDYNAAVDESKTQIFTGQGNLMGYLCENESGSDVYIAFYDAAQVGDVTLGVTTPVFTQRVKTDDVFGRDSDGLGYAYFENGCVVAVTSTRAGATAPAAPAILETWASKE